MDWILAVLIVRSNNALHQQNYDIQSTKLSCRAHNEYAGVPKLDQNDGTSGKGNDRKDNQSSLPCANDHEFLLVGSWWPFAIYFTLLIRGHFQSSKAMMQILSFVQHAGVKQERAGEASVQRGDG